MFYVYPLGDKKHGKILPREEVLFTLKQNPNAMREMEELGNSILSKNRYVKVPCRKCFACRLNYSAEWATRIELECKKSDHNYFLTLTYNDENLPKDGSLHPEDVRKFINSLRKEYERKGHTGIKYFYCGEYGELGRPHYHMILMNCPLDLEQFYSPKIDSNYKEHWKSHELEWYWAIPIAGTKTKRISMGFVDVAYEEWSDAAYVARYCMKKARKEIVEELGKHPEFVAMSKGIGMEWFEDHKDQIYENDEIIMKTIKGNTGSYRPPKAFDRKYEEQHPEKFQKIKKERIKQSKIANEVRRKLTTYTDMEQLIMAAENVTMKAKMLPREAVE